MLRKGSMGARNTTSLLRFIHEETKAHEQPAGGHTVGRGRALIFCPWPPGAGGPAGALSRFPRG
jgi:hypothetical protein